MAIGANSYGDTGEIGALVPRYSGTAATFHDTTRPTLKQVESLVDQVSAMLNASLAELGFTIPVTDSDAKLMLDLFVNQEVADVVLGMNGSGRFGPTTGKGTQRGRFALLLEDVTTFIKANATGIERLGAARSFDQLNAGGYRGYDEGGDEVHPIFQRDGFGNSFRNWDSD